MMFKRKIQEINTSSMADIAFLLLIFFLVSTTIDSDKGIQRKLPPVEDSITEIILNKKNVLDIIINGDNELLVNNESLAIEDLNAFAVNFISHDKDNAKNIIVNLQNTRNTNYDSYLQVQNELTAAYKQLREEESINNYTKTYRHLSKSERKVVKDIYPIKIVESTIAINK